MLPSPSSGISGLGAGSTFNTDKEPVTPTFQDALSRWRGIFDVRRFRPGLPSSYISGEVFPGWLPPESMFSTPRWVLGRMAEQSLKDLLFEEKAAGVDMAENSSAWWGSSLALTYNPYTPAKAIRLLVKSGKLTSIARKNVALRKDVSKKILQQFCGDSDIGVRSAAAKNPKCPEEGRVMAALAGVYFGTFKTQ